MRYLIILFAAMCGIHVSPAAAVDESDLSCAELAARRAERQYTEEEAAREDRQAGMARDNALQRDLLRLEADSYRKKVYKNCMRLRGFQEPEQQPSRPGG